MRYVTQRAWNKPDGSLGHLALGPSFKTMRTAAVGLGGARLEWGSALLCGSHRGRWTDAQPHCNQNTERVALPLLMEWQKNVVDWTEGFCLDPRVNFIGSQKRMRKDEEGSGSPGLDGSANVISVLATRNHGVTVLAAIGHVGCRTAPILLFPSGSLSLGRAKSRA